MHFAWLSLVYTVHLTIHVVLTINRYLCNPFKAYDQIFSNALESVPPYRWVFLSLCLQK